MILLIVRFASNPAIFIKDQVKWSMHDKISIAAIVSRATLGHMCSYVWT